jgi:peptidoglycan/LPS O-acetylase OafA/YrhL
VPDARHRLREIDVLRGFAAVWVMFSHYLPHWNDFLGPALVIIPRHYGYYAVELFFVISGFVIFMTLDRCRSVRDFAVLRFSRLYPAYWATLLFVTAISIFAFGGKLWVGGLLANLTMFQEFIRFPNLDNVYWSLTVELAFYVNAAWLFALGWHRRLTIVLPAWLLISCLWALTLSAPQVEVGERDWLALLFALDHAPFFVLGIVFFDAAKHGWSPFRAAMIAFAIAAEYLISAWTGVCVAAVVTLVFWAATRGHLRFLVARPTLWLGAISYSLYLVHRNLGYQALDWMHAHGLGAAVAVPVAMVCALLLATLFAYGIERPALARIRSWHEKRSAAGLAV